MLRTVARLNALLRKANFNPNQPRLPRGRPDGGQWTRVPGAPSPESNRQDPPVPSGPPVRVGTDSDPLDIPRERPRTEKERNATARRVARWLFRNGYRVGLRLSPIGRAIDAAQLGLWIYEQAPLINAYLDPPKTMAELQRRRGRDMAGYDTHHIVERTAARQDGYPGSRIEAQENKVVIPRLKHWLITRWYMTKNKNFGGLSPRDYLRGRSWAERRRIGIRALILHGVLKP